MILGFKAVVALGLCNDSGHLFPFPILSGMGNIPNCDKVTGCHLLWLHALLHDRKWHSCTDDSTMNHKPLVRQSDKAHPLMWHMLRCKDDLG